ncbi:MAG: hypothetical protein CML19_18275 [Pusillimonas sp.]|nr:hypothetical protein [Pusillimonas sp.]|tara:strand:- start:34547 stop:34768 length:222 start_codon:yes stop_codon:yes gene_type:complete
MSKGKGKGGSPKVYAVIRSEGKGCTVIARSAKAAIQIAKEHGVTIMQGRAVLPTEIDPRTATDALNHPSRKSD